MLRGVRAELRSTRQVDPTRLAHPGVSGVADAERLVSCLCRSDLLRSEAFRHWLARLREPFRMHRKLWELAYITQALYERDMIRPGRRGLVFAVGREPTPALLASLGCEIVATDLAAEDERSRVWDATSQWAANLECLNERGICEPDAFRRRVSFRTADMNDIPTDLRSFDFTWSTCAFEHCGSIDLGLAFLERQMACLRPGGVAVHTTEFNLGSNRETITTGPTVIFRMRDMETVAARLRAEGHRVEPFDLHPGDAAEDRYVDPPPYGSEPHMRLLLARWPATSIGIVVEKGGG
jgi:hypothetical protein